MVMADMPCGSCMGWVGSHVNNVPRRVGDEREGGRKQSASQTGAPARIW